MHSLGKTLFVGTVAVALQAGCRDNSPPVPRVPPPAPGYETLRRDYEPNKPMPAQANAAGVASVPFDDPPLLIDTPPEARRFVEVYRQVGRPRIVVFVNRTLDGQLLPTDADPGPVRTTERNRRVTAGVEVESRDYSSSANPRGSRSRENVDKFKSDGPGEYTETTVEYLRPGQYDELQARAIDYNLMETLLADWMSADNQVGIVSPLTVRKTLTDEQAKSLQSGAPEAMSELARQLDADVLIQVQARPTRQTPAGLELRIVAEAVNVRGGESLARAAVDLVPPLDKPQVNKYTRFLARKLMDGMATAWSSPPAAKPQDAAPSTAPQSQQ